MANVAKKISEFTAVSKADFTLDNMFEVIHYCKKHLQSFVKLLGIYRKQLGNMLPRHAVRNHGGMNKFTH